jgi:NADH:ubiquinone oxidoreductase subunit K
VFVVVLLASAVVGLSILAVVYRRERRKPNLSWVELKNDA